ncbi:PREDICTED: keratin, type I cytoskeletal 19-like [Nanorana parkeri]|uniref:keratin, type I cytoskeletal 19-like n=1 Tax=Nanorana parkeri TaxID=125878 RepID=UPI000854FAE8|nr:PREDICTED: keratin, type I cytoskeletal 19-like [Nanorana parkeri]
MSVKQGVKGLGSSGSNSVRASSVRVCSGTQSHGGFYGGGAGGSLAGGYGGYGFSSGSGFGASSGFGHGGGPGFGIGGGHGSGFGYGQDQGLLNFNEKNTMQNLNDRLASYLDKVQDLEQANAELEKKIRQWYESHGPKPSQDYSHYFKTIEEIQKKIHDATIDNGRITLQIDNARLAADDFKLKYENELFLRQTVEADINGLRRVLDDLTLSRSDLEAQLENLKDEKAMLKKNHEEDMKALQGQVQGTVNVDLNPTPGIDLQKILGDMRHDYESIMAKNKKDMEDWYRVQTEELSQKMKKETHEVKSTQTEITDLRRTFQSLEIDLQAQISMKAALEGTLAETEGRYCMKLAEIQNMIQKVEEELANIRCDMSNQSQEYQILLDTKARLEKEINTYRSLLDGQGTQISKGSQDYSSGSQSDKTGGSYNVRIRTEDSDGRVISTHDQKYQSGYRK